LRGIKIWTDFSFVLSQSTRLMDRLTDRQTDRQKSHRKTALHSMQRSKNEEMRRVTSPSLFLQQNYCIQRISSAWKWLRHINDTTMAYIPICLPYKNCTRTGSVFHS